MSNVIDNPGQFVAKTPKFLSDLLALPIDSLIQRNVPKVRGADSREAVWSKLTEGPWLAIPVTDEDDKLEGVITRDDLQKNVSAGTAGQIATKDQLVAILKDANVWALSQIMTGKNKRGVPLQALPVVADKNSGRVIGMIFKNDAERTLQKMRDELREEYGH
jgi:CBS domain-containing protein